MPKVLTSEQIEQYHEEGFISPVRVMSTDKALSIKKELIGASWGLFSRKKKNFSNNLKVDLMNFYYQLTR